MDPNAYSILKNAMQHSGKHAPIWTLCLCATCCLLFSELIAVFKSFAKDFFYTPTGNAVVIIKMYISKIL